MTSEAMEHVRRGSVLGRRKPHIVKLVGVDMWVAWYDYIEHRADCSRKQRVSALGSTPFEAYHEFRARYNVLGGIL